MTQAVLLMSTEFDPEAEFGDLLDNDGLRAIIAGLGVGVSLPAHLLESVGPEFLTYEGLRYHKVIITLLPGEVGKELVRKLLYFLYFFQRPLVQNGHVYLVAEALAEDDSTSEIGDSITSHKTRKIKQIIGHETWEATLAALG